MRSLFLGIDTSNYKSSIAVSDANGNILFERSEYLDVPKGKRGLRQSDAFFQQSNKIPELIEEAFINIDRNDIKAIGVSSQPRKVEGSYMPCFLAGVNAATIVSKTLDIPLYHYSHQEGHAAAVIEHNDSSFNSKRCLFFHLSGGTTEFLLCEPENYGYKLEIIGGTKDISFGQLLDRIGVAMDFSFPSGVYMDKIASENEASENVIPSVKLTDNSFNLSGIETFMLRYAEKNSTEELNKVITELFIKIATLIYESATTLCEQYNTDTVYVAGGVASSKTIRGILSSYENNSVNILFGKPELSGDNAVGISYLTCRTYMGNIK